MSPLPLPTPYHLHSLAVGLKASCSSSDAGTRARATGCSRREVDFGDCRCQALAITGDAREADPVCTLSPFRERVDAALAEPPAPFVYREFS